MKSVVLVTSSLACGGAEKAVVLTAEGLLNIGYKVSLITFFGKEADFYEVSDGVNRVALNFGKDSPSFIHGIWNNLYRSKILRKVINSLQPDVVISQMYPSNILTLISLINTKYPVIVTEQIDPKINPEEGLWGKLRRLIYPLATKVVSVSLGVDQSFEWLPKKQRAVIYNPLQSTNSDGKAICLPVGVAPDKKLIVAMGRLDYQKNFELLLSAFHQLVDKYPDWQLLIFGEGKLRPKLEGLIKSLNLTNKAFLAGVTQNPISVLKMADLFVLSSRFEGLPLVLLEALACELPVISTDCPSGPKEVIQNGIDGILVPSEDIFALAAAMESLMSNPEERNRLASCAFKAVEHFQPEKIIATWNTLIDEVTEAKVI